VFSFISDSLNRHLNKFDKLVKKEIFFFQIPTVLLLVDSSEEESVLAIKELRAVA